MKVLIATPVFGRSIDVGYHISILEMMKSLIREGIGFGFCHEARNLINQARNRSVHYALNNGFDKILFIDADIVFRPEDVMTLVTSKRRVIGGTYPLKTFPITLNFTPKQHPDQPERYDINELMKTSDENGDLEVHKIPGGFMCIDMSVFKDLEPYVQKYHHRDPMKVTKEYENMYFPFSIAEDGFLNTEDWSFCELVQTKLNEKIYWNTKVIVDHAGQHVFSANIPVTESYKKIDIHQKAELLDNPFKQWPRNLQCFCGSGEKFKKCHDSLVGAKISKEEFDVLKPEFDKMLQYVQTRADQGVGYKLPKPTL